MKKLNRRHFSRDKDEGYASPYSAERLAAAMCVPIEFIDTPPSPVAEALQASDYQIRQDEEYVRRMYRRTFIDPLSYTTDSINEETE